MFAINIDPDALEDIRHIARDISQRVSPSSAARWQHRIISKIQTLASLPERYPMADEAVELGLDLRFMIFGRKRQRYRILYTIDGQTVNVYRVRHAAQDYLKPGDI